VVIVPRPNQKTLYRSVFGFEHTLYGLVFGFGQIQLKMSYVHTSLQANNHYGLLLFIVKLHLLYFTNHLCGTSLKYLFEVLVFNNKY